MTQPTVKQSLRSIIVKLFPWLPGFVAVAGAKGKGLAIRSASGLLHLAGVPDDPAVVRVGDLGTAGTITLVGPPGAGTGFTIVSATGTSITFSFVYNGSAVIVSATSLDPHTLVTKSTAGSEWVTCR